jgi:hypothetical protein
MVIPSHPIHTLDCKKSPARVRAEPQSARLWWRQPACMLFCCTLNCCVLQDKDEWLERYRLAARDLSRLGWFSCVQVRCNVRRTPLRRKTCSTVLWLGWLRSVQERCVVAAALPVDSSLSSTASRLSHVVCCVLPVCTPHGHAVCDQQQCDIAARCVLYSARCVLCARAAPSRMCSAVQCSAAQPAAASLRCALRAVAALQCAAAAAAQVGHLVREIENKRAKVDVPPPPPTHTHTHHHHHHHHTHTHTRTHTRLPSRRPTRARGRVGLRCQVGCVR